MKSSIDHGKGVWGEHTPNNSRSKYLVNTVEPLKVQLLSLLLLLVVVVVLLLLLLLFFFYALGNFIPEG